MRYLGNYYIKDKKYFGKGAFSKIYKGYNKYTNSIVAIKQIKVEDINKLKIYVKREIDLHSKLNHENIVKVYDIIFDEFNNYIYMVLEYCEKGDLSKYQNKRRMNEIYIQNFFFQLRNGLKYLRNNNIVHRDLKPQNLLITNHDTIKISDFGLAKEFKSEGNPTIDLNQTYCGSPLYMSPELMQHKKYSSSTDLWSIGIILYELITGQNPFKVKNYNQLLKKIKQPVKLPSKYKKTISSECYHLLNKLLNIDTHQRISWDDFFNHPWLKTNKLTDYHNSLINNPLQYNNIDNLPAIFIEENLIDDFKKLNEQNNDKKDEDKNKVNNKVNEDKVNNKVNDEVNNKVEETNKIKKINKNKESFKNKKLSISNDKVADTKILRRNNKIELVISSKSNSNDEINIIDTYSSSNDIYAIGNLSSTDKKRNDSSSSDIYLSTNEMINGMESYDSDNNQLNDSDSQYYDSKLENSDNKLNNINQTNYQKNKNNSIYNLLGNTYDKDNDNDNDNSNFKREDSDFVKVDISPQNDMIFTTSLMSSNEVSKPINITRTYNLNKNYKKKYDFHSEIENSVQEKIKRDNLSPNKSSIESILNSSLNIIKESYSYISNSNSHKSL